MTSSNETTPFELKYRYCYTVTVFRLNGYIVLQWHCFSCISVLRNALCCKTALCPCWQLCPCKKQNTVVYPDILVTYTSHFYEKKFDIIFKTPYTSDIYPGVVTPEGSFRFFFFRWSQMVRISLIHSYCIYSFSFKF